MIEIKNLYKRYHNHHSNTWVLKDVNIIIPSGVSVGLIGANGAGKSTLLRLIAGMDTPDRGEVIRHSRVSWPVGLSGGMQGSLTGRQNVKFVARAQGRSREIDSIIKFVEDFSEIGTAFDEPVNTYSSGMRSRISFGLSLAFKFDVYISDEATAVGDRSFKEKAKKLFRDRVDQASLIMVSHSEGILKELCVSGIYIKEGHAIWYDNIREAIKDYHLDIDKCLGNESVKENGELFEVKQKIKELQPRVNGMLEVIKSLRADGWSEDDLSEIKSKYYRDKKILNEYKFVVSHEAPNHKKMISSRGLDALDYYISQSNSNDKESTLSTKLTKARTELYNRRDK